MNEFIHALLIEPKEPPRPIILENSETSFRAMIGGKDIVHYGIMKDPPVALISSPKQEGSVFNRLVPSKDKHTPFDMIWDTFLIVGCNGPDRYTSLAPDAMMEITMFFAIPDKMEITPDGTIHVSKALLMPELPNEMNEEETQ